MWAPYRLNGDPGNAVLNAVNENAQLPLLELLLHSLATPSKLHVTTGIGYGNEAFTISGLNFTGDHVFDFRPSLVVTQISTSSCAMTP